MPREITETDVLASTIPTGNRITISDSIEPGLGLRFGVGVPTWTLRFVRPEPATRRVIGSPPRISLDVAREIARRARAQHQKEQPVSEAWFVALLEELGVGAAPPPPAPRAASSWHESRSDAVPAPLPEIGKLVAICREKAIHPNVARTIEFSVLTGLDRRDVCGLRHADLEAGYLGEAPDFQIALTDRLKEIVGPADGEFVFPPVRRSGIGSRPYISENSLSAVIGDLYGPQPEDVRARMRTELAHLVGDRPNTLPFRRYVTEMPDGPPEMDFVIDLDVLQAWEAVLRPHIEAAEATMDVEAVKASRANRN